MSNKEGYKGCFGIIAIICSGTLIVYGIFSVFHALGNGLNENPDKIIGWIFGIGTGSFLVYAMLKEK